ncbi:hypothetical protein E2C01_019911 [Portunus trituberculatus]|uniref:Uncharacterized protein n=1 Tax=Portunus trituberculatus TaxID=210409 RepID=A0A5B7E1Q3_PORTR|nr:hypothetical protein [Portunus trituberculatus]
MRPLGPSHNLVFAPQTPDTAKTQPKHSSEAQRYEHIGGGRREESNLRWWNINLNKKNALQCEILESPLSSGRKTMRTYD